MELFHRWLNEHVGGTTSELLCNKPPCYVPNGHSTVGLRCNLMHECCPCLFSRPGKNVYFPASWAKFPSSRANFPPVWDSFRYVFIYFFPPNHKISWRSFPLCCAWVFCCCCCFCFFVLFVCFSRPVYSPRLVATHLFHLIHNTWLIHFLTHFERAV